MLCGIDKNAEYFIIQAECEEHSLEYCQSYKHC